MKYLFVIGLVVLFIVLGPIAIIWALNTLFPVLAIPFTLETWIAALIVSGMFRTSFK